MLVQPKTDFSSDFGNYTTKLRTYYILIMLKISSKKIRYKSIKVHTAISIIKEQINGYRNIYGFDDPEKKVFIH